MLSNYSPNSPQITNKSTILYILDEEGILFSATSGKIYYLNTSATFIWCHYEKGLSPLKISGLLAEHFGISARTARQDVIQAFIAWRAAGLLSEDILLKQQDNDASERIDKSPKILPSKKLPVLHCEHCYRLLDIYLRVRYPCQLTKTLVHPVFKHLEIYSNPGKNCAETIIDIVPAENGYTIFKNNIQQSNIVQPLELAPLIQREALLAAYEHSDCAAAIHSAAICDDQDQCILLPAPSGAGKSTLTAALLSSGLTYLTDELNLLTSNNQTIRPAYVSLSLKRGSWLILSKKYGFLNKLPTHIQDRIIEVKYLSPPENKQPKKEYHISCLVFPKYCDSGSTRLTNLSPAEAFYRIAQAGYDVPRLDRHTLEMLIDWIVQFDSYELNITNLDEAVRKIKGLFL